MYKRGFIIFGVVSLTMGNSAFPLAHGGRRNAQPAGCLLLRKAKFFALLAYNILKFHSSSSLFFTFAKRHSPTVRGRVKGLSLPASSAVGWYTIQKDVARKGGKNPVYGGDGTGDAGDRVFSAS